MEFTYGIRRSLNCGPILKQKKDHKQNEKFKTVVMTVLEFLKPTRRISLLGTYKHKSLDLFAEQNMENPIPSLPRKFSLTALGKG